MWSANLHVPIILITSECVCVRMYIVHVHQKRHGPGALTRTALLCPCTRPPPSTGYYFLEVLNDSVVLCAWGQVGWVLFFDFLFVIYGEDTTSFEEQ